MKLHISSSRRARDAQFSWNGFVELCTIAELERLAPEQRPAYLVFWYDAELQSGGHLQYLQSPSGRNASEAAEALAKFGLLAHAAVLREAADAHRGIARPVDSKVAFIREAIDGPWYGFDRRLAALEPTLTAFLMKHAEEHAALYIELDP